MDKNRDHIWSFPLIGGILSLIGLFTPASIFVGNFNWMWGFSFFDGSPPLFLWSLLQFLLHLTPLIIILVSSIFAIVLSFLIRKNGDIQRFQKLIFINGGLFIFGSFTYFFTSFSLIWPFWQFYLPGFAMIAPLISGAILIFGHLINTRLLMKRAQKPELILKIKKFYRNILFSLSLGGVIFLIGSVFSYVLIYVLPGDPVAAYLTAMGNPFPSPAEYQAAQQLLGFDLNPILQYIKFLCQTCTGNLGVSVSIALGNPVAEFLVTRIPRMLEVIVLPIIIVVGPGILLGRFLAKKRGKWYSKLIQLVYMIGLAFPVFVIGLACQYFLAYGAGIIPATGYKTMASPDPTLRTGFLIFDSLLDGNWALAIDIFYHLLTPMIILVIATFALITWQTRSHMTTKTENRSVFSKTFIISSVFGFIFMFYVLIDITFNLSGFGDLLLDSLILNDYFLLIRCVFVLVIVLAILLVISSITFSVYKFLKSLHTKPQSEPKLAEKFNEEDEGNENIAEGNIKEYLIHSVKRQGKFTTAFKIVLGGLSAGLLIFFILIALFPQLITQYTLQQAATVQAGAWNPPSPAHPLGQTQLGFDVQGLIMYGIGDSMFFGIVAALVGLAGGLPLGYLAGRFRKWIHGPVMGLLIFFYIFPMILILLLVNAIFGIDYVFSMLLVGVLLIPIYTVAFSNIISGDLTDDVKRIGKKTLSQIPLNLAFAVLIYNALGFLGFAPVSIPQQLGGLIRTARMNLYTAPWATFWPALAIFGILITFIILYLVFQDYGATPGTFKLKFRNVVEESQSPEFKSD